MHLPGYRSNRPRPVASHRAPRRNTGTSRLAVEHLEVRTLMHSAKLAASDPVGGPAVDAATQANQLTPVEVNMLLERATAADPYNDAIIAVVDRSGRVLGVRVENGVSPDITEIMPAPWSSPLTEPSPRPEPEPSSPATRPH
jgi:hypothetical protein